MQSANINIFHAAVVAPVLGFIGYKSYNEEALGSNFGIFLIIVAILVFFFHVWIIYQKSMNPAEGMCGGENATCLPCGAN